ncbi:MAG TPA: PilZ domain-containing protein [Candidatus Acidoferrales bacterium]
MHFLPEQLTGLPESSDRRGRVRRNPSAIAYLDAGEGNGGIVLNVSETGLAIAVAQALTDDEIPLLSFRLPQLDRTFQAGGEVVWRSASKRSAGVRFVNLEERDRMQIRNWIRAEIVEAELKTPIDHGTEPSENTPAAKSVLLVMPSRAARKAARDQESEAERDQARAAEFDRMFPSEAELTNLAATASAPRNDTPIMGDHADVELAAEAFLASQELEASFGDPPTTEEDETGEIEIPEEPPATSAAYDAAAGHRDWREEWERFHLERENLERVRSSEAILELPRQFSAPLPEVVVPLPEIPVVATAAQDSVETVAEMPAEAPARKAEVRGGDSVLGWYQAPKATERSAGAAMAEASATAAGTTAPRKIENSPQTEKNLLSIAALCTMLVLMCFILGYAIQPGSFRFSSLKRDASSAEVTSTPAPVVAAPVETQTQTDLGNTASTPTETNGVAASPAPAAHDGEAAPLVAKRVTPNDEHSAPTVTSPARAAAEANPTTSTTNNDAAVRSQLAQPPAPSVSVVPNATPNGATAAPDGGSSSVTIVAPVPVSFFPVTAPAAGSPAKLMQLPEETVAETHDILIRSHQFLFVPALPGPEATHELQRVHLGDRIAKAEPAYPPQSLERFKGSSIHLRSTINADGSVADVQAISGPTSLIPAAVNAVRQWRYKPTDIDGKAIAIEEDIVIELRPSHS